LRILYLRYGPQSGVAEAVVSRLNAAGHDVRVFDPVDGFLYKRKVGGFKVPNLAPEPVLASVAAMARFGRYWKPWYVHTRWAFDRLTARCHRAVLAARPDVVLQAGVLFAPGRDRRTRYCLYCDHTRALNEAYPPVEGLDPPIPFEEGWRRREAAVYLGAEAIFTMSEHVKRSLSVHYGVDPALVTVVGAGPNVEPPAHPPQRQEGSFLFVGHPFVPKGGPEALAAFAAVRARHPRAELWMVGGQQPDRAPPGVKLLGRLPAREVARAYARAAAFVLPTLREAFGLAFLEAMTFGLPCIGTDIEAIPEIVVHGETGLLVPPRDPGALSRAMLALLDAPDRARAMGEAGRTRVAERFGWDRAVRRMLEVMRARVAPRASPAPVSGARPAGGVAGGGGPPLPAPA
jgi:starch synthase